MGSIAWAGQDRGSTLQAKNSWEDSKVETFALFIAMNLHPRVLLRKELVLQDQYKVLLICCRSFIPGARFAVVSKD